MLITQNTERHEGKVIDHFEDEHGGKLSDLLMCTALIIVFTDGSRIKMMPDWRGAECYFSQHN